MAVAAVLAAVMSTTDALLLACSSAVAHDLLGSFIQNRFNEKVGNWVSVGVAWIIGLIAMFLAYSPPKLITELFVAVFAGFWWI